MRLLLKLLQEVRYFPTIDTLSFFNYVNMFVVESLAHMCIDINEYCGFLLLMSTYFTFIFYLLHSLKEATWLTRYTLYNMRHLSFKTTLLLGGQSVLSFSIVLPTQNNQTLTSKLTYSPQIPPQLLRDK